MLETNIINYLNNYNGNFAISIKNFNTNEHININENQIFPSASTIKLLILAELLRQESLNEISLNKLVRIKEYPLVLGDGILKELSSDISLSILDIATLMIILSDNYATNILIDILGFDNINNMACTLNLKNTKLQRKMMDQEASKNGLENLTTSSDMLNILDLIYNKDFINTEMSDLALNIMLKQQVGGINVSLNENIKVAHKTGDLDNLEHDVGIVFLENNNYALSILTNELDSNNIGKNIIQDISKLVFDYYNN